MVILGLIHAKRPAFAGGSHSLVRRTKSFGFLGDHNDGADRILCDSSFKLLTYQLLSVRYWLTEAVTGNGELGFDSGEGALETATTSKDGSRRANYPIPTRGGSDQK
jgi:hypothetical protein